MYIYVFVCLKKTKNDRNSHLLTSVATNPLHSRSFLRICILKRESEELFEACETIQTNVLTTDIVLEFSSSLVLQLKESVISFI